MDPWLEQGMATNVHKGTFAGDAITLTLDCWMVAQFYKSTEKY